MQEEDWGYDRSGFRADRYDEDWGDDRPEGVGWIDPALLSPDRYALTRRVRQYRRAERTADYHREMAAREAMVPAGPARAHGIDRSAYGAEPGPAVPGGRGPARCVGEHGARPADRR